MNRLHLQKRMVGGWEGGWVDDCEWEELKVVGWMGGWEERKVKVGI